MHSFWPTFLSDWIAEVVDASGMHKLLKLSEKYVVAFGAFGHSCTFFRISDFQKLIKIEGFTPLISSSNL